MDVGDPLDGQDGDDHTGDEVRGEESHLREAVHDEGGGDAAGRPGVTGVIANPVPDVDEKGYEEPPRDPCRVHGAGGKEGPCRGIRRGDYVPQHVAAVEGAAAPLHLPGDGGGPADTPPSFGRPKNTSMVTKLSQQTPAAIRTRSPSASMT